MHFLGPPPRALALSGWALLPTPNLRVVRTVIMVDGKSVASEPKTKGSRRTIPLDGRLVELLRIHRSVQAAERMRAGLGRDPFGHVFALGQPLSPEWVGKWFGRLVKSGGFPPASIHDCRHVAASLILAAGVPVKVVAEILGHASTRITNGVYAHFTPSMGAAAGEQLSAALLG